MAASRHTPRTWSWRSLLLELLLAAGLLAALAAWNNRDLLSVGERSDAPPWTLDDLDGRPWSREDLGGRPAVLYFFAPWCGVCAASSPQLRWFEHWAGDSVQLVLIGLDWNSSAELADYADRHDLEGPVLAGRPETAAAYRVRGYPTYYVIDSQGRIAARDSGFTTALGLWIRTRGL